MRNFAAYAGMIAGFTAAIVALNAIQAPDHVLMIALSRASTITIGIIVTTLVFALTDFGGAPRRFGAPDAPCQPGDHVRTHTRFSH